ncbi:MAG: response regulator [Desulfobacteraceae bacterium]|nr:response regulator [Desulfobacteraceae bacterium]
MNDIIIDFIGELENYIPRIRRLIEQAARESDPESSLDEIHRMVHSTTGASSMVGLKGLSRMAHHWEDALEQLMDGRIAFDTGIAEEMNHILMKFEAFAKGLAGGEFDEEVVVQETIAVIDGLTQTAELNDHDVTRVSAAPAMIDAFDSDTAGEHEISDVSLPIEANIENSPADFEDDCSLDDILEMTNEDDPDIGVDEIFAEATADDKPLNDSNDIQAGFLDSFRLEAEEHLEDLSSGLQILSSEITTPGTIMPTQRDQLQRIRRSVHTLKGAAATIGFKDISAWAHKMEDLLDWLYEDAEDITPQIVSTLIDAGDLLEQYLNQPGDVDSLKRETLQSALSAFLPEIETETVGNIDDMASSIVFPVQNPFASQQTAPFQKLTVPASSASQAESSPQAVKSMRVNMERVDAHTNLAAELTINFSALEQRLKGLKETVDELELTRNRLKETGRHLEVGYEVKAIQKLGSLASADTASMKAAPHTGLEPEFDPLEMDQYSEFNLIIRAIKETVVDVGTITSELANLHSDFDGYLNRQYVLLSDLQNSITRIRMTPMKVISNRLYRTVRETAKAVGKEVNLAIVGEEIELDRRIWEKLADPLMHLLRNAIDHGIETPDERRLAGKPETGQIRIEAAYAGNNVKLIISDDGSGLDHEAIRQRVQQVQIHDRPETLDNETLSSFVFHPGFSTREDVTAVSGRGIGLDVVKENINALQGSVWIDNSRSDTGIRFNLQIPLTIGLLRAITFSVNDQTYAISLNEIDGILRIQPQDYISEPEEAVRIGDAILPLYHLSEYLPLNGAAKTAAENLDQTLVLNINTGNWKGAVAIEELFGQREIVVKNLGDHLQNVKGVTGVTITGDGKIIPILNLTELIDAGKLTTSAPGPGLESFDRQLQVLVVDDSVSVRQVVSRLVETQGWAAMTAKDGVEALEKLQDTSPDVIILDVEMPRMNGYEFLGVIRAEKAYRRIPVIMLTSRTGAKHRMKAVEMGAQGYLGKPYDEKDFITQVLRVTGRDI